MEWLTLDIYLLISWQSGWLKKTSFNINSRCIYMIRMQQMGEINCVVLSWWLCLLVYIWRSWKMVLDTLGKIFHMNVLGYSHWFMSISTLHINDHSISVDQDRYATSIVYKYMDTATFKTSTKFYKTTLPSYDLFQPKTSSFSTRALIWVHSKTVYYFSQPIFSLFSYLKDALHNLVIELCSASFVFQKYCTGIYQLHALFWSALKWERV